MEREKVNIVQASMVKTVNWDRGHSDDQIYMKSTVTHLDLCSLAKDKVILLCSAQ